MKYYYYSLLLAVSVFIFPYSNAQTTTFNYTGTMQTYVVPAGVTSLDIDMSGARGGYGTSSVNNGGPNIPGYGGRVQTTLDVMPGQTLYIYVGGVGADAVGGAVFNAGGFNGGGSGYRWASAGGGASDIRIGGTTLNERVIVAGGGGGYGDNSFSGDFGGNGGDLTGANGESGGDPNGLGVGFAGDQSNGGAGGQYSIAYGVAGSGQLGLGGDAFGDSDGGGGGAGYYGGGAGSYSGGGGGSSYTDATLTNGTIHTQGFKNGAGEVIITENCSTVPVPDAILSDLTDVCSVSAPTSPTATSCTGTYTGTPNVSFPITAQGTTVVTWTYDDGNGNTTTQSQNVIISDATAPVADISSLSDITSECEVTPTAPIATDNCAGAMTATPNISFPITASGTTVVTWTYDDGNGNTSTQTQNVIITPIDNGVTQVNATTLTADASGYNYQWVDCDNSNAPINGETGQTFVASSAGNYAVEIDNGTCTVVSACTQLTVGIDEKELASLISVYPNPTNDYVTVQSSDQILTVVVRNAAGRIVSEVVQVQSNSFKLELPDESGLYFISVENVQSNSTIKLIKH